MAVKRRKSVSNNISHSSNKKQSIGSNRTSNSNNKSNDDNNNVDLQLIEQYKNELLDSKKYANNIAKLLNYTLSDNNNKDNITLINNSILALNDVFTLYYKNNDLNMDESDSSNSAIQQYKQWLSKQHHKYISALYSLLHSTNDELLQNTIIQGLIQNVINVSAKQSNQLIQSNKALHTFLQHYLSPYNMYESTFNIFNDTIHLYIDLRYYILAHIQTLINQSKKQWNKLIEAHNIDTTKFNNTNFLQTISYNTVHTLSSYKSITSIDYSTNSQLYVNKSIKTKHTVTDEMYKDQLNTTWLSYLCNDVLQHSHKTYIYTLTIMYNTILPSITTPLLLSDYLTDSYNFGGQSAVLALQSLFHLIHKHNLDYPQFYPMLYKLLGQYEIYNNTSRSTLFKLLPLFLTTRYIPNYMILSFVKRLARISLYSTAPVTVYLVALIYKIVQTHKNIRYLLYDKDIDMNDIDTKLRLYHQQVEQDKLYNSKPTVDNVDDSKNKNKNNNDSSDSDSNNNDQSEPESESEQENNQNTTENADLPSIDLDAILKLASTGNSNNSIGTINDDNNNNEKPTYKPTNDQLGKDPFNADTNDITQTNAQYSSLWEIHTLQNHYISTVATLCKSMINNNINQTAIEIDKYINYSYNTLFDISVQHRQNAKKQHINYIQPTTLFNTGSGLFNELFVC